MTSPLALLANASPAPSQARDGAKSSASSAASERDGSVRFPDIMARRRAEQEAYAARSQRADAPATGPSHGGAKPAADPAGASPARPDGAGKEAEDAKAARQAGGAASAPLPQQALAIAGFAAQMQAAAASAPDAAGEKGVPVSAAALAGKSDGAAPDGTALPQSSAVAAAAFPTAAADSEMPVGLSAAGAGAGTAAADPAGDPVLSADAGRAGGGVTGHARHPAEATATAAAAIREAALADEAPAQPTQARSLLPASHAAYDATARDDANSLATTTRDAALAPSNSPTQALAGAWQINGPLSNAAGRGVATALEIRTPVGQAQWGGELGSQVALMAYRGTSDAHTAELRLDPPDLGPLRVTIAINEGVAQASFVSAHAAVRQAVENALPQLQHTLAQAGISLGQASVSDHGAQAGFGGMQQDGGSSGRGGASPHGGRGDVAGDAVEIAVPVRQAGAGLVDTFA